MTCVALLSQLASVEAGTGRWSKLVANATLQKGMSLRLGASKTGVIWLDDVSVVPTATPLPAQAKAIVHAAGAGTA